MSKTKNPELPIILIDDDPAILKAVSALLSSNGFNNILPISDSRKVLGCIETEGAELVILDLAMPFLSGRELLSEIRTLHPEIPVVVVTATNDVATAVECLREGALDYVVKGVESSRLISSVARTIEMQQVKRNYSELRRRVLVGDVQNPDAFRDIVTSDREILASFLFIESIAKTRETVLISGETGVGKDLVAEAVHRASGREGSFVRVNSGGLDDDMFSDTLFGHSKGAFTGAGEERKGLVNAANAGTLFLDEIGDLSPQSQLKLLHLVERREYYQVGSDLVRKAEVRFVVATNHDLPEKVARGEFRRDLYFRLSTHSLNIPPLRKRKGDIAALTHHFMNQVCAELKREVPEIMPETLKALQNYDFPGNVRELRAIVYDSVARLHGNSLTLDLLPQLAKDRQPNLRALAPGMFGADKEQTFPTIEETVGTLISQALTASGGNQAKAAVLLGISPAALSKRLQRKSKTGSQPQN